MKTIFNEKMSQLAQKVNCSFDGGEQETRLFFDIEERIDVFANLMTKKEYNTMEKEINNTSIKGSGFEVYAWNDNSGYEYWKEQGNASDSNYIMITANITNIDKIDILELRKALSKVFNKLSKYDNKEQYFSSLDYIKNIVNR